MKLIFSILLLFSFSFSKAGNGYKVGETVADITVKKILNNKVSSSSLKNLQGNITILDFFEPVGGLVVLVGDNATVTPENRILLGFQQRHTVTDCDDSLDVLNYLVVYAVRFIFRRVLS